MRSDAGSPHTRYANLSSFALNTSATPRATNSPHTGERRRGSHNARPQRPRRGADRYNDPQCFLKRPRYAPPPAPAPAAWPRVPRVRPLRFRYDVAYALDRDDFRTVEQLLAAALRTLTGWLAVNRHPTSERLAKAVASDDAYRASPIALHGTFSQRYRRPLSTDIDAGRVTDIKQESHCQHSGLMSTVGRMTATSRQCSGCRCRRDPEVVRARAIAAEARPFS
jgi:hypothetical protein